MSSNYSSKNDSSINFSERCYFKSPFPTLFLSYSITYLFLFLPLCLAVLGIGLQRWWFHRSSSTSFAVTMSHCDSFTYHLMVMELLAILGWMLQGCNVYFNNVHMYFSFHLIHVGLYGEMCFHDLSCAERHLAVVYPVTYRNLRGERGVRIRNGILASVWIVCLTAVSLTSMFPFHVLFVFAIMSLSFISFCSLAVLCVLIGPRPGEPGGDSERVHRTKRRAFYTIMASLVVLLLRFGLNAAIGIVMLDDRDACLLWFCHHWFGLPSSLMLPVLFLLRARQGWQKKPRNEESH